MTLFLRAVGSLDQKMRKIAQYEKQLTAFRIAVFKQTEGFRGSR